MRKLFFLIVPLLLGSIGPIVSIEKNIRASNKINATWLWNTQQIVHNPYKTISFLEKNNIKDLYLQIDYELGLNHYKDFILLASEKAIDIHALDGRADWVANDGQQRQEVFFNWVTHYETEASENENFKGIHLDVEPYLYHEYESDKNQVLQRYQAFLENALIQSKNLELPLSIDIPFWFDELTYHTEYGEGILAEWIISRVKNIVIMAYRDEARGDNGIIDLASGEMELAKEYGANIVIALETERSDEGEHISFYGKGSHAMNKELRRVYKHYNKTTSFDGFAIHHLISWMNL